MRESQHRGCAVDRLRVVDRLQQWSCGGDEPVAHPDDDHGDSAEAHLQLILDAVEPGVRLVAGDRAPEWWVRRGVIWPFACLNDRRAGINTTPAPEIAAWAAGHPDVCAAP